jgi:hypothetical protein
MDCGLTKGAEIDIKENGIIFTYETTSAGTLNGNGKIFVYINFKHVQGTKNPILNIIYYGIRPFSIREIQIMEGGVIITREPTQKNEYDITP